MKNRDSPKLVEFISLNPRPMYILVLEAFFCLFTYKMLMLSTINRWPVECKKLRWGWPVYFLLLETMFKGVVVDGSTSCIPG
jgi:hypothetical protein